MRILALPVIEQHFEGLRCLIDRPIQLRSQIVQPAVAQPEFDICIQLVVLAEAGDAGGATLRTAETERADAELNPALFSMNAFMQALDQRVDILPAPVGARQGATAGEIVVPGRFIGKIRFHRWRGGWAGCVQRSSDRHWIGIKIIVEMHAIDIVAAHHVEDHVDGALRRLRLTRIHP